MSTFRCTTCAVSYLVADATWNECGNALADERDALKHDLAAERVRVSNLEAQLSNRDARIEALQAELAEVKREASWASY